MGCGADGFEDPSQCSQDILGVLTAKVQSHPLAHSRWVTDQLLYRIMQVTITTTTTTTTISSTNGPLISDSQLFVSALTTA